MALYRNNTNQTETWPESDSLDRPLVFFFLNKIKQSIDIDSLCVSANKVLTVIGFNRNRTVHFCNKNPLDVWCRKEVTLADQPDQLIWLPWPLCRTNWRAYYTPTILGPFTSSGKHSYRYHCYIGQKAWESIGNRSK